MLCNLIFQKWKHSFLHARTLKTFNKHIVASISPVTVCVCLVVQAEKKGEAHRWNQLCLCVFRMCWNVYICTSFSVWHWYQMLLTILSTMVFRCSIQVSTVWRTKDCNFTVLCRHLLCYTRWKRKRWMLCSVNTVHTYIWWMSFFPFCLNRISKAFFGFISLLVVMMLLKL